MRHIVGKLSTSSFQRYKVCANRSSDEGVMAPGSRGIGAVFVHSSGEDSDQTGDAFGEPRVPRRSRSHYLSNAPGLADQLVASRKDSAREGGSCAAYFCKVPDSRESELGLVRYGPASRVHRGVFGPFEGSFPIRIPADPDKFLAIREFHVVHGCVLFPMCPGSQINLLRVRKTLCASAATSVGKFRKFQHSLISSACFHARGRRSSRCRILTILVSSESLRYLLFNGTRPCTEASLGSQDMVLRTGGRRNVPYAKGGGQFDPVFGLVNGPVKPLVDPSRAGKQLGQTSVKLRSTLVKLGQTLGNVSRTFFLGVFDADEPSSDQTGLVRAVSFCVPTLRENPGAYLGGNVCAEILSGPLQFGPRAKTLRQEVHFSYHMQLSDHQELLRSSRNLSQKMTPWHKERSNGLRSQDHILRTQARLCARPVPLENRVFLTRNKLIHKPGCVGKKTHSCTTWNSRIAKILSGQAGILIGKLPSNGPKTLRWPLFAEPYLTSPSSDFRKSGTLQKFEKKRAGRKTRFSSRTAAFARRVFPARNKLIYEPGCVGKITTPATSWNSRFAESIPHLIGIFTGKVHENSSNAPTSGSHNSLIRTPIHANFVPLERGRRELSGDMLHDPF
uniref:Uncharacterized protein n=1 Tax=Fagus sylvatica TaxID=28930 RepID=A0A2N9H5D3_FAGSY